METKDKVSKLTEKLLIAEQNLNGIEGNLKSCQTKLEKSEKAREKWHGLYFAQREASNRDKLDSAMFSKRATEAERKYVPTKSFLKRIWELVMFFDSKL